MADYDYIIDQGVIIPDTANTRAQVEAEFRAAFGQDLVVDPSTPQGVLITKVVEERDALARNNAELANQINPDIAGGIFLDGIWALSGGGRKSAERSTIASVNLGGVAGTVIPVGVLAKDSNGNQFESTRQVTLDGSGAAEVDFIALDYGPIDVGVGGLNAVASSVLGWETVYNDKAAVVGRY